MLDCSRDPKSHVKNNSTCARLLFNMHFHQIVKRIWIICFKLDNSYLYHAYLFCVYISTDHGSFC